MMHLPHDADQLSGEVMTKPRASLATPTLGTLALRGLAAGALVGTIAALSFASVATAQNIAGVNGREPVDIAADRIDLQDRQNRVVLSGNVVIRQGDMRLTAERTTIAYTDTGSLTIQRLDATGNVVVTRGTERATGAAGTYDFNRKVIVLSGGVALRRGNDQLTGGRLVIDLNTGLSSVDGNAAGNPNAPGRITGRFTVPEQN